MGTKLNYLKENQLVKVTKFPREEEQLRVRLILDSQILQARVSFYVNEFDLIGVCSFN